MASRYAAQYVAAIAGALQHRIRREDSSVEGINRFFLIISCLLLLSGVQLGALGSHALDDILNAKQLSSWALAVQYQLVHGIGLLVLTLLANHYGNPRPMRWAQWLMLAGVLLFSGNIYLTALAGPGWPGIITPFGGVSLMLAWLLLAVGIFRGR